MTRTEAPKDFAGRGEENLARTTPELPAGEKKMLASLDRFFGFAVAITRAIVKKWRDKYREGG
jgi:hypothetical protein